MNYSYLETKAGFKIAGKTDADIVTAGGGTKAVSDFAMAGTVIKTDPTGGISNGSDSRSNTAFFEYNWAGTGYPGSVINFSGLNGKYSTELFADYSSGNAIGVRTRNGDGAGSWNGIKWLWHSGNFDPSTFLASRSYWNNAFVAKTDFPNSVTFYAEDPSISGLKSFYGTSLHIKGDQPWYNRLDISTDGNRIDLWQGINVTDMVHRGLIPIIPDGVTNWTSQEFTPSNYVTKDTPENILARKTITGATGNRYDEGSLELRGNGEASGIYPTIGFHQQGSYAGTISLRAGIFCFRNTDDSDFNHIEAKGYIMQGLDDNYFPLAGGGYKAISDFATVSSLSNYVPVYGDIDVQGVKKFTGTSTQWVLNNDATNNANGFMQSYSTGFFTGTSNDKDYNILRNNAVKIKVENTKVTFTDSISTPANISATGSIYGGAINSTVFFSPTMAGNFVINTDVDTLYFGNSVVSSAYYQAKGAQYFFLDNALVASVSSIGFNMATGKSIYSDKYASSTLTGNTILDVVSNSVLVLGNDSLPNVWYSVLNNHVFISGGSVIQTINSSGVSITGVLNVNGQTVATQTWVNGQLSSYATLSAVQTFSNTITFSQSPIIPNGTLGTHAVNVNQLNSKADKSIVINAGTGLTGGGDLSGNRTLGIDSTTLANIEKGVEAYNYGNHASQGYLKNANGFIFDSLYREIDTDIDLDDTSIKEYHIVFDSSTDAKVTIVSMTDGQTFRISNFSAVNTVELWVNGYPVAKDTISAGDTRVYLSHHSGKLQRLSANPTGPII